jgi:hypothetical protein
MAETVLPKASRCALLFFIAWPFCILQSLAQWWAAWRAIAFLFCNLLIIKKYWRARRYANTNRLRCSGNFPEHLRAYLSY